MLQMMFPKSARVQQDVETGKYISINRSRPAGSPPRIPSLDMWDATVYDLNSLYNFIGSFESKGSAETVLTAIATKLNATWRPSFKKALAYLKEAPRDRKTDLNRRMNKVYRLYYLKILKQAKKAFTKEYPRDIYTYEGKKLGNLKGVYDHYIKLFS